jgi:hypothetical protein
MTPAAEAAWAVMERIGVLEDYGAALAAFLEVVTDQVVPADSRSRRQTNIRRKLLALAAELRKQGASSTNATEAQS